MKKLINLVALVMLVGTNVLTPFSYAQVDIPESNVENSENEIEDIWESEWDISLVGLPQSDENENTQAELNVENGWFNADIILETDSQDNGIERKPQVSQNKDIAGADLENRAWDSFSLVWEENENINLDKLTDINIAEVDEYTVTFDANRWTFDSITTPQTIAEWEKIIEPIQPQLPWYDFEWWYDGDTRWNFDENVVTQDVDLKAKRSYKYDFNDIELYYVKSDWTSDFKVMMDRNLWASEVWNWLNLNQANIWSFGYHYQWWNNYGFESCYTTNCVTLPWWEDSTWIKVDDFIWKQKEPSKYTSNVWNTSSPRNSWAKANDNLWWWSGDKTNLNWAWTLEARQWPCPNGYYIPSVLDWKWIFDVNSNWASVWKEALLSYAWYRRLSDKRVLGVWGNYYYFTSSPSSDKNAYSLGYGTLGQWARWDARSIRCFNWVPTQHFVLDGNWWKNTVVSVLHSSWTNEYNIIYLWTPTKLDGYGAKYVFEWWYTDSDFSDDSKLETWDILIVSPWDIQTIYAKRSDSTIHNVTFDAMWWFFDDGLPEKTITYIFNWLWEAISQEKRRVPTKSDIEWKKYMFDWWYTDENLTARWTGGIESPNLTLYAKYLEFYDKTVTYSWVTFTIMDRNLWATEVYNWFTWSRQNPWSIGYHYQYGNNYWFSICWDGISEWCTWFNEWEQVVDFKSTNRSGHVSTYYDPLFRIINPWNNLATATDNLWGWSSSSNPDVDKQWPCPAGYHVPDIKEWQKIVELRKSEYPALATNITKNWVYFARELALPFAWYRRGQSAEHEASGAVLEFWYCTNYWSSSPSTADNAFIINYNNHWQFIFPWKVRSNWRSLRCFKNTENNKITFNSNGWTTVNSISARRWEDIKTKPTNPIKQWYTFAWWYKEPSLETQYTFPADNNTAYNITESLILYAKWVKWDEIDFGALTFTMSWITYTIMDRNLWATKASSGNSAAPSVDERWFYYQWWNNSGYPAGWWVVLSEYDASVYNWNWNSKIDSDMQWPCPSGYHVPTSWERNSIFLSFNNRKQTEEWSEYCEWYDTLAKCFSAKLQLPFAWRYVWWTSVGDLGWAEYWSSNIGNTISTRFSKDSNNLGFYNLARSYANPVRCFKDTATITFNTMWWTPVESISARYGLNKPEVPERPWYTSAWWYKENNYRTLYDFDSWEQLINNTTLYAKWTPVIYTLTISGVDGAKTITWKNYPSEINYNDETEDFLLTQPVKDGCKFIWRKIQWSEDIYPTLLITKSMWNKIIIAIRWNAEYTITYKLNGWSNDDRNPNNYTYGVWVPFFQAPSKKGYTFAWWKLWTQTITSISATSTWNKEITATWTANTWTTYYVEHQQERLDWWWNVEEIQTLSWTTDAEVTPAVKSYEWFTSPSIQTTTIDPLWITRVIYKYIRNNWKLTVNYNWWKDGNNRTSVEYNQKFWSPIEEIIPTREWYTFAWWDSQYPKTMPAWTNNIITAQRTINQYNIIYKNVEYATNLNNKFWYNYGENFTLSWATREWYVFNWWYTEANWQWIRVAWITLTDTWDKVLYAYWTPATNTSYKVIHIRETINQEINEGITDLVETENLKGTTLSNITPAVKTYTWFKSPAIQTVQISPDGSTVVKYVYQRKQYNFQINPVVWANTQWSSVNMKYFYEEEITLNWSANIWYTWSGWIWLPTGVPNENRIVFTMPANNVSITPILTHIVYTITFDSDWWEPVSIPNQTWYYEDTLNLPEVSKEWYRFDGWYEWNNRYDGTTKLPNRDVDLKAKWTEVEHHSNNALVIVKYYLMWLDWEYPLNPTDILNAVVPIWSQYTWVVKYYGWFKSPSEQSIEVSDENFVIEYRYPRNKYTLSLKEISGFIYNTIFTDNEYYYGENITIDGIVDEWYIWSWWKWLWEAAAHNSNPWIQFNMPATWVIVTPNISPNTYKVLFRDWEDILAQYKVKYLDTIPIPVSPSKQWYTFAWWKWLPADLKMIADSLDIWAQRTKQDSWWGWWGSSSRWWGGWWGGWSSKLIDKDTHWSGENIPSTWSIQNNLENDEQWDYSSQSASGTAEWQNGFQESSAYSQEYINAYEFAKWIWITTMSTIQEANMEWKLTRIAMAKMLSQYAMNILWQKPENIVAPKFNDVTDKQNSDYDNWVTLAYQLWIMWQNMPWNNFRPNDEVTRAEFATALSRMLYNTSDGEYKWTWKYYIHHIEKLMEEWIITKDDPNMKEKRWYVMLMLLRSVK